MLLIITSFIPLINALPTIEGPTPKKSLIHSPEPSTVGPPAPPPPNYAMKEDHPPIPNQKEEIETECPTKLLTSAQINLLPPSPKSPEEPKLKLKTLDEIILENTKEINASDVREGDVRIVTGALQTKSRRRRDNGGSDDYDYLPGNNEAAEPPGLSINEIDEFPIDGVPDVSGRNAGVNIDEIFQDLINKANEEKPLASDVLAGRAKERGKVDELVELDILLTAEQKASLFDKDGNRKKRAAVKQTYWTKGILPYSFMSNAFSDQDKTQIYAAMREWQGKTCIRFEPYSQAIQNQVGHKHRIMFQDGGGCSSYVGMIKRGPQPVTLARGCRIERIISHELGHAIGLHHEQCRPDRDDHVKIIEQNVYPSMLYNFDKYSTREINSRNFKYDYYSIMHYGKTAFSRNGQITIQPNDRNMENVIGNQEKLSTSDSGVVDKMYRGECDKRGDRITTTRKPITVCKDQGRYCAYWKSVGQCSANPGYMTKYCTKSCGKCTTPECKNENQYCEAWKNAGYCKGLYEGYMKKKCAKSCGTCGQAYGEMKGLWKDKTPTDSATASTPGLLLLPLIALAKAATN